MAETSAQQGHEKSLQKFTKPSTPKKRVRVQKTIEKEDPRIQEAFRFLQQPIEKENQATLFGKYLGEKLHQFDHRTQSLLIHKINNLIFEVEFNTFPNQALPIQSQSPTPSPRSLSTTPTSPPVFDTNTAYSEPLNSPHDESDSLSAFTQQSANVYSQTKTIEFSHTDTEESTTCAGFLEENVPPKKVCKDAILEGLREFMNL